MSGHDSKWNHALCDECWVLLNPDRAPYRVMGLPQDVCCRCGTETYSGIYVRAAWEDYHPGETYDAP